jgi:tRNA 2-selenouridine synthase
MNSDANSSGAADREGLQGEGASRGHIQPGQLNVREWSSYALVIDARSPHEYAEDHIPGAVNLPVVDDAEYAEVGTRHRTDKHAAYLVGVEYSLRNIAAHIKPLISRYKPEDRFLVYCFRGGKRSRLWADNLRTIGFEVDVLAGGWKNYRRWVRTGLEELPKHMRLRILAGPTGCGKTRMLHALERLGEQVVDLEGLASHRGSLLGDLPGEPQPAQKLFDSALLERLRRFDPARPVWLEAESRKIGNLQLPEGLIEAMHAAPMIHMTAPMSERVRLWREDYPHLAADPVGMVRKLEPLKPLVGGEVLQRWRVLAQAGLVDELFERVMVDHYDPCYTRSTTRNYGARGFTEPLNVPSLAAEELRASAQRLAGLSSAPDR